MKIKIYCLVIKYTTNNTNIKIIRNAIIGKAICKANHIELIALMTPMCSTVKGLDYFDRVKSFI
jgi:hypothetical protein